MRGATYTDWTAIRQANISIHAPHAGSDEGKAKGHGVDCDFNPRSPCGERPLPRFL